MVIPERKPAPTPRRRGPSSLLALAGFLTIGLGILTVSGLAAPLDNALQDLGRLQDERTALLAQADSLGRALSLLPSADGAEAKRILRQAERISKRCGEVEMGILLAREGCRTLAQQELAVLRSGGSPEAQNPARELVLRDLLAGPLADLLGGETVVVQPDSLDSYEALLDKQAYLQDLRDRVTELDRRLEERIDRLRRERALREASDAFTDEVRFLDEGGRVGSDEAVRLRGTAGSGGTGGDTKPVAFGGVGSGLGEEEAAAGVDLGLAAPPDPITALDRARAQIAQDLNLVSTALETTRGMLRRFPQEAR